MILLTVYGAALSRNVECSDFNYSPLEYGKQPGNEKMASTVSEKTIQITVEQETSKYANILISDFVLV